MSVLWRISSNHILSILWTQLFLLDFLFMYFTIESFLLFCAFITHTMIHSWLTNDLLWALWAKSWKSYPCYLFTFFIEENEPPVPPAGVHLPPPPICWPDPLVQAHPGQAQAQESSVASSDFSGNLLDKCVSLVLFLLPYLINKHVTECYL